MDVVVTSQSGISNENNGAGKNSSSKANNLPSKRPRKKNFIPRTIKEIKPVVLYGDNDTKKKTKHPKDSKDFIKVIANPKNVEGEEIQLSQQGPKKIIKMVVPPKNGNETTQGPNQIIKVVVPKTIINGKEINLERSEINKILKFMSASENIVEKGIQIGKQNLEADKQATATRSTNDSDINMCSSQNSEIVKQVVAHNVIKLFTQTPEQMKVLTPVSLPKNIDRKQINLITLNSTNSKTLIRVGPPTIIHNQTLRFNTQQLERHKTYSGAISQNKNNVEPEHTMEQHIVSESHNSPQFVESCCGQIDCLCDPLCVVKIENLYEEEMDLIDEHYDVQNTFHCNNNMTKEINQNIGNNKRLNYSYEENNEENDFFVLIVD